MSAGWDLTDSLCTDRETKSSLIWTGLPADYPGVAPVVARPPGLHLRPTQVLASAGDSRQHWSCEKQVATVVLTEVRGLTPDGSRAKSPEEAWLWDLLSCHSSVEL